MKKIFFAVFFSVVLTLSGGEGNDRLELQFKGDRTIVWRNGKQVSFKACLKEQLRLHPSMQLQEVLILCLQGAYGSLGKTDFKAFTAAFEKAEPNRSGKLFEMISPDFIRVDHGAWKAAGLPGKWLFNMSAANRKMNDGDAVWKTYLAAAKEVLTEEKYFQLIKISQKHKCWLLEEKSSGSLVSIRFLNALPVLEKIKALPDKKVNVIAIDGRAASGKTTLSRQLGQILETDVIHMDDFFLPLELRTAARYGEPGGNVHYERFISEVLPHLCSEKAFVYRKFNCSVKRLGGNVSVRRSPWRIVEGAYSLHPKFGDYADFKIFYDVPEQEQMRRITLRNGEKAAKMFQERWIPLEEKYIRHFDPAGRADLIIGSRRK